MEENKNILKFCMEKGFLLDKEMLGLLSDLDEKTIKQIIDRIASLGVSERVITKNVFSNNFEKIKNVIGLENNKVVLERFFIKLGYSRTEIADVNLQEDEEESGNVKLLNSFVPVPKKVTVPDFVNHFRARYNSLRGILQQRDLENLTSIRRLNMNDGNFSLIVSIADKRVTKNKNLLIDAEDLTGRIRVLVNKNKKELFERAKDLLPDEVVAFTGNGNKEWLFANDMYFPDAFVHEKRHSDKEELIAFTSDIHTGSRMFLEKNFLKFIKWLNGEEGDEQQRDLAKKVKYLFITGDSVDGVGVFPDQQKFLNIDDMRLQYKKLTEMIKLIRKDIKIIICPGQHDAVWVGEPQPPIPEEWASDLYKLDNVILVSNPSLIEIDGGFKILMYHGASMHGIINNIEDLRLNDGHSTPTKVSKEMLKRRHLNPIHGEGDYVPNEKQDPLIIEHVPDIFATGDQHKPEISSYNNVLLVASSCWQSVTPFEEKVGHNPDPCKVPIFNMKTREIKIMDFADEDTKKTQEEREQEEIEEKHKKEVEEIKQGMEIKNEVVEKGDSGDKFDEEEDGY